MLTNPNAYKKITLVCYPPNAGGKFLINCLGLSSEAVFQNDKLAQDQLIEKFNYSDKIKYLHNMLDISQRTNEWNDLNLGCLQLFGTSATNYSLEYHEIVATKMNPIIDKIINCDKHIFLVVHSPVLLDQCLKFWINANIIFFTNYRDFVNLRADPNPPAKLLAYWNEIKGPSWPVTPPCNKTELDQLPDFVQDELTNDFGNEIMRFFSYSNYDILYNADVIKYKKKFASRCFEWDVENNYKNSNELIKNLKKCQDWLGLPNTPDNDIIEYYNHWMETIF